jgi:hypothetical protein
MAQESPAGNEAGQTDLSPKSPGSAPPERRKLTGCALSIGMVT